MVRRFKVELEDALLQNSLNCYHIAMEAPERLDKDSDEALLERSRSDPEAFRDFYERHARRIYEWFKHRTPSTEVAHDLTAETFAQALSSLRRFRGSQPGAAGAWLQAIAMNMLRIYYRKTRVESRMRRRLGMTIPTNAPVDTDRVDDLAEVEAFAPLLASALRTLTHDQRKAVEMRVMQQMTYEAIASRLDCTQATARMRVSRGLRNLNRFMEGATI